MEKYFAAWLIAYILVFIGVVYYMGKKNRKYNLDKITLVAGLGLAITLLIGLCIVIMNN